MNPDDLLTTAQAAALVRFTESTLRSWRKRGIGPVYKQPNGLGGKVFYRRGDLEAWMNGGGRVHDQGT